VNFQIGGFNLFGFNMGEGGGALDPWRLHFGFLNWFGSKLKAADAETRQAFALDFGVNL